MTDMSQLSLFGSQREKTCHLGFANIKSTYQPAHLHNLISAFVIRLFESNISKNLTSKISIFLLVSVIEQTGQTGFVTLRPICVFASMFQHYAPNIQRVHLSTMLTVAALGPFRRFQSVALQNSWQTRFTTKHNKAFLKISLKKT